MSDTPTHKLHILQVRMQQVVEWTKALQAQRALIVEKVAKVKANSKAAREMQVHHALERTLTSITRALTQTEERLNKVADQLNKARGLFLEVSDFEVALTLTEHINGDPATSTGDRGDVSQSTTRSTDNASAMSNGGTTASPASADHGHSEVVQRDAGYVAESHRHDGHS